MDFWRINSLSYRLYFVFSPNFPTFLVCIPDMARKDRDYTALDIIRITSKNMSTNDMRKLYFWFQVVIPLVILGDLWGELFIEKFAPQNRILRAYIIYRKAMSIFKIDILKFIVKLFLPKDAFLIVECIRSVQGKFGQIRD